MTPNPNSRAPLIGIAARLLERKGDEARFQAVGDTYIHAISAAGGTPVLIPLSLKIPVLHQILRTVQGVLLAGGEDVEPKHYGEAPHPSLGVTSSQRDLTDMEIVRFAERHALPILGICRGVQVMNVALGGSLYQDIPSQRPGSENHSHDTFARIAHTLSIQPASKLATILGTVQIPTNSRHHQSVKVLAPCLHAVATSSDGIVEGIEHPTHPFCLGVQSHPEVLWDRMEPAWERLFSAFVQAATRTALVE